MIFSDNIAKKYGFAEAILLQSIYNWCNYNKKNNKNNFDDKYWMYNTKKDFLAEYPYLKNINTISNALKVLKNEGLILTGNFNNSCTRTTWYAVTDKAIQELSEHSCVGDPQTNIPTADISQDDEKIEPSESPKSLIINSEIKITDNEYCKKEQLIIPKPDTGTPNARDQTPISANSDIRMSENKHTYVRNQTLISVNPDIRMSENRHITNNNTNNLNSIYIEREINKEKEEKSELDKICLSIFDCWNNANIMNCDNLTPALKGIIRYSLKFFSEEQIKLCINRYETILHDKTYFYSYPCSLKAFLTKSNAIKDFMDNGDKWIAYNSWKEKYKAVNNKQSSWGGFIHNNYTKEQIDSFFTDFDDPNDGV